MKNNRLKLLFLVLIMFSITFFMSIGKTKAIYREVKSTTISLTVISGNEYTVDFVSDGGGTYPQRNIMPNDPVGTLPVPTKTGYNFAGWYDSNNQRVYYNTPITADTTLTARWVKIVCKKVPSDNLLHTEKCEQSAGNGCRKAGYLESGIITYGFASSDNTPSAGEAYDCDVNNDGTYNATDTQAVSPETPKYTERFYFMRENTSDNKAVLIYYTTYDQDGRVNTQHKSGGGGSYHYEEALTYLPENDNDANTTDDWSNPLLTTFDGKTARLVTLDDIESVCGTVNNRTYPSNYLYTGDNRLKCQVLLENSRFQKESYGRAGIWIAPENSIYRRIHTKTVSIATVEITGSSPSSNTLRPVIEIPMLAMEGFSDEDEFTINFSTYNNDPDLPASIKRYRGQEIGSNLPIPVQDHYTFTGWYTDSGTQNAVDPTALVSSNMTLYAGWQHVPTVDVTIHLNDGTIVLDGNTIVGGTTTVTIDSGDLLDNLPDPTRTGYTFAGWYTDSSFNTSFDDTVAITADMDLYAKWEEIPAEPVEVTIHLNGGTIVLSGNTIVGGTTTITLASGDLLDNLPDPTQTGYIFDGWYTDSSFNTSFDDTVAITADMDLYAKWEVDDKVAEVNGERFSSLALAINAVPNGNVKTTVTILKDITLTETVTIPNGKHVELDIGSYTIDAACSLIDNSGRLDIINGTMSYTDSTNDTYVINNKSTGTLNIKGGLLTSCVASNTKNTITNSGVLNITGGRITNGSPGATINNKGTSAILNMSAGEIIGTDSTNKSQGIYNENGTLNISGTAYIENASSGSNKRSAVHNYSGTTNITGGTIVSKNFVAVKSDNGTTTIGINDANGNIIDTTTPVLIAADYALQRTNGTLYVYDGVFKTSKQNATTAVTGTINIPSGTAFDNSSSETIDSTSYLVSYLKNSTGGPYVVTFDPYNDGTNTSTVQNIASMGTVGGSMPSNPTKTNYIFEKWYINVNDAGTFTSSTPIVNDITVTAKWKPGIGTASISPASISIAPNQDSLITVTGPDGMEGYTFTSDNTNVATVDANGVVTGVASGNTIIRIIGSESGDYQTITVTVGVINHTVRFYDVLNGTLLKTTQVEHGTKIGAAGMPDSIPTRQNYVFSNWYINGETSSQAVDANTLINNDTTIIANWHEIITYATLTTSPDPFTIIKGATGQITISPTVPGEVVENLSYSSSNTNVATVNSSGLVTAGSTAGTSTITITGTESTLDQTITVTVIPDYVTVTFNEDNGSATWSVQVEKNTAISGDFPSTNPTRSGYVFAGWYVNGDTSGQPVDATLVVSQNTLIKAVWKENVQTATVTTSPDPLELLVGATGQITVSPTGQGMTVESFSFSSSNTNVATVNNSGLVTAGSTAGTSTITIAGTESGENTTVTVTVSATITRRVTFKNGNTTIKYVDVDNGETVDISDMPADPTDSNYVFTGWYIDGDTSGDAFDTNTPVTADLNVLATWKEKVSYATVSPSSITIIAGNTTTITVTPTVQGDIIEDYTFASSNSNYASVNQNTGVVTGVAAGSAIITITGASGSYKEVQVTVTAAPTPYQVTFDEDNGNQPIVESVPVGNTLENYVPSNPTKANYIFDNWYLYDTTNNVLTSTEINREEVITEDRTYVAKWAPSGTICKMNGTYYSTVQDALDAIDTNDLTTIYMLADFTDNTTQTENAVIINLFTNTDFIGKNVILDLQGHTISYTKAKKVYVLRTRATLEVRNGIINSNADSKAAVEADTDGTLILKNITVNATGNRHAIYNDGGTIYIYDGTQFSSQAEGSYANVARATVSNVSGTMYIYGGTITNSKGSAVSMGTGSLTIGTNDGTIDITTPVMQGKTYGLDIKSGSTVTVYDGIFKGENAGINAIARTTYPSGTSFDTTGTEGNYNLAYLVDPNATTTPSITPTPTPTATPTPTPTPTSTPSPTPTATPTTYTITFESIGGTISPNTATINQGTSVANANLPTTAEWGDKTLSGWYLDEDYQTALVPGTTIPTGDTTYYAKWTITPSGSITSFRTTNDAMVGYYNNINTWKNSSANFPTWTDSNKATSWSQDSPSTTPMFKNFTDNDCSCYDNQCSTVNSGSTRCDLPKGYSTGVSGIVDVYLYDETTHVIGDKIDYAKATSGTIYNLVPNQAYYWENHSDAMEYGFIKFTGERRILNTGDVRNTRDLGGLTVVDNNGNTIGHLKYEKLYRGMKLESANSVTELTNLGINSELDLRESNNDTNKLSRYERKEAQNYYVIPYTTSSPAHTANSTELNYYNMTRQGVKYAMQEIVAGRNVFFHCRIGADRTGTIAYILEGLLGVADEERVQDYELSFFSGLVRIHRYHDYKPGSSVGTGYERFTYMHDLMPSNQSIYNWYMYANGNDQDAIDADDALIAQFKAAMIDYN